MNKTSRRSDISWLMDTIRFQESIANDPGQPKRDRRVARKIATLRREQLTIIGMSDRDAKARMKALKANVAKAAASIARAERALEVARSRANAADHDLYAFESYRKNGLHR